MRAFSKTDDAAADAFAIAGSSILVRFAENDHRAADNTLSTTELNKWVSHLDLLGIAVVVDLDLLDISNTSVVDVITSKSCLGIEGIVDIASGLATLGQITVLHDFEGVQAGGEASKLSND